MELINVGEAQKITGKALVIQELNEAIKLTAEAGKTFFVIVEAAKIYRYINQDIYDKLKKAGYSVTNIVKENDCGEGAIRISWDDMDIRKSNIKE